MEREKQRNKALRLKTYTLDQIGSPSRAQVARDDDGIVVVVLTSWWLGKRRNSALEISKVDLNPDLAGRKNIVLGRSLGGYLLDLT